MALHLTALLPVGLTLNFLTDTGFWIGVGVLAGIYALVALGLQLNVGYTGMTNFGAAGFMAVGAYSMAILVLKAGFSFWLSLPAAMLIAIGFGLLVGLPSLRLRADYFAIATIALAEIVRIGAQNADSLTGGNQGLFCSEGGAGACYNDAWTNLSHTIEGWFESLGWTNPESLAPLLVVVWLVVVLVTFALRFVQSSPWGRVLRAIREDEDAAEALGKNTFVYKLQSLAIAAAIGAVAGFFLALDLATIHPLDYEPVVTFFAYGVLVLGGLASYWGVLLGSVLFWVVVEGTRFVNLTNPFTGKPMTEVQIASLRFFIVGLVLILLMAFRPQGMFGKREEMVLGE
jgi:branched-chain amino acid transport system permease protein